jgi:hypothetical protein
MLFAHERIKGHQPNDLVLPQQPEYPAAPVLPLQLADVAFRASDSKHRALDALLMVCIEDGAIAAYADCGIGAVLDDAMAAAFKELRHTPYERLRPGFLRVGDYLESHKKQQRGKGNKWDGRLAERKIIRKKRK